MTWPSTARALVAHQAALGRATQTPWSPPRESLAVGGCFVCFPRGLPGRGERGDPGWAAAVVVEGELVSGGVATGEADAAYEPGLLALREGPLLERAVRSVGAAPDVLLVNATGRDHPRRADLALHLGAVLAVTTIGVTHRPLIASGEWPPDETGARSPLEIGDEAVGYWLRTRTGTRPLAVHAAWRTDPDTAVTLVLSTLTGHRTPGPLRMARTLARAARASAGTSPA